MTSDKRLVNRWRCGLFALVAACLLILETGGAFRPLERLSFDVLMKLGARLPSATADDGLVIVAVDEPFIARTPEPLGLFHPYLGGVLESVALGAPRLIAIDMLLPQRSYEGFRASGEVEAGHPKISSGPADYHGRLIYALTQASAAAPTLAIRSWDPRTRSLMQPHQAFSGAIQLGDILRGMPARTPPTSILCPDDDDVIRAYPGQAMPSPGARCQPESDPPTPALADEVLSLLGRVPPPPGYIDFAYGPGYRYLSFDRLLALGEGGKIDELKHLFQDKVVLIGSVLDFEDRKPVPLPLFADAPDNTMVPGVFVHAQAVRAALANRILTPLPAPLLSGLLLLASLIWFGRSNARKATLVGVLMVGSGVAGWSLYREAGIVFPFLIFVATIPVIWLFRALFDAFISQREKQQLTRLFGGYVSAPVMNRLLTGDISLKPQGSRVHACILFADIRNFTTRSEKSTPEESVALLNRYLGDMTAAITEAGGCVDKFIGDGIMALFGAPEPLPDPEAAALRAARAMLLRLEAINRDLTVRGGEPIAIGIGVHCGDVIIGSIGSEQRLEFTAIGDVVNTASRLEGLTKTLHFPIVVSAAVRELAPDPELVACGPQEVKGRASVVVFGLRPGPR